VLFFLRPETVTADRIGATSRFRPVRPDRRPASAMPITTNNAGPIWGRFRSPVEKLPFFPNAQNSRPPP